MILRNEEIVGYIWFNFFILGNVYSAKIIFNRLFLLGMNKLLKCGGQQDYEELAF